MRVNAVQDLKNHAAIAIRARRVIHVEFYAQLLLTLNVTSSELDPNREAEWSELRCAAATVGHDYGIPDIECRRRILARLAQLEGKGVAVA